MRVLAIIPAKLDSKRLKHKNIREIDGKPMFLHSVDYADASRYGVEVIDVYQHIINEINEEYDIVVGLQPDNPNRVNTLDECIDYMIENKYDDIITVNPNYKRSGSVRIFKYNYLYSGEVSKRLGCIKDDAIDIHYESDLELVKSLKND
jgi:CMP-N-acetylneuraminic acid synthetase